VSNGSPLSTTVGFSFADGGQAETFRWVADGGGRWGDLANWENVADPAKQLTEPPHAEDLVYFPTNPGLCTVTVDGDYGARRLANLFEGTLAEPLHFVLDLGGHAFDFSEPEDQSFASVQTASYTSPFDKSQPPSVIEIRNGTVTSSRLSDLAIGGAGGVILSNVVMSANLKHWSTGSRLTLLGGSVLNILTKDLWVNNAGSGWNGYLRVAEQSIVSNSTHNVYMNGGNSHIYVEDGGRFVCSTLELGFLDSTNAAVVVDGGTFCAAGEVKMSCGTESVHASHHSRLAISGEKGCVRFESYFTVRSDSGARVDIDMPVNGFRDDNGDLREGLYFRKFAQTYYGDGVSAYEPFAVNVSCRDWARAHPNETAPIVRLRRTGIDDYETRLTAFTNAVRIVDKAHATLSVVVDGDDAVVSLTAAPWQGLILSFR
ncbi:MAG TPA: hypothetical protein PKI32_02080, partial [Opitutales bacterium]|nr:hypothetical protein [Opitutales bacterium]